MSASAYVPKIQFRKLNLTAGINAEEGKRRKEQFERMRDAVTEDPAEMTEVDNAPCGNYCIDLKKVDFGPIGEEELQLVKT